MEMVIREDPKFDPGRPLEGAEFAEAAREAEAARREGKGHYVCRGTDNSRYRTGRRWR